MTRWIVQLKGDPFDLEEFPHWFPDGDVYAIAENGNVYITGSIFEALTDAKQVYVAAFQALDEFSAVIALLWPNFQRPSVGTIWREGDDGERQGIAFASGSAKGRSKVRGISTVGGEGQERVAQTTAQHLLAGSRVNDHLKLSVSVWSDPLRTWPRVYRVLEEIERYLGQTVDKAKLCEVKQRKRFRRSANTAEIAGKDARHAPGKFRPPKNPMNLEEATIFVSTLFQAALDRAASETESANSEI